MSCIKIPVAQNDVSSRATESNDDLPCVLNKNNELVNAANRVFVDGWSHSVTNTSIDFIDNNGGKYSVGCYTTVKVQLANGIYHEDMGYCNTEANTKGLAIEKARVTSVTNALHKVLSCFTQMKGEMKHFNSSQNSTSNISSIVKTKVSLKRPISPQPPAAQSTPKVSRIFEKILEKKTTNTVANGSKVSESRDKMETENIDFDIMFESPLQINTNSVSNAPAIRSTSTSSTLTEEEMRLEKKLRQREKKEELKNPPPINTNAPTTTSTTTSATMTEEEMRLERKRKQREKQEEFKRQMKNKEEKEKPNAKF